MNLTQYDHLRGISSRHSHPHIPEPEVAMIFRTKSGPDVDMNLLESQLRKAKKEVGRVFYQRLILGILLSGLNRKEPGPETSGVVIAKFEKEAYY